MSASWVHELKGKDENGNKGPHNCDPTHARANCRNLRHDSLANTLAGSSSKTGNHTQANGVEQCDCTWGRTRTGAPLRRPPQWGLTVTAAGSGRVWLWSSCFPAAMWLTPMIW